VTVEKAEKQFRRRPSVRASFTVFRPGELVPPAKVYEAIDVALVVVELNVASRVERDLELGLREIPFEVDHVAQARRELDLSESIPIFAVVVKILNVVGGRIEDHWLSAHVRGLVRAREEVPKLSGIRARAHSLAEHAEVAGKPRELIVQSASRNPRGDVHDSGVLVPVLGVPAAGGELDLVDYRWLEQLVDAARYSRGHRYAIDVVGVLRVLASDVDLARRRARGTRN